MIIISISIELIVLKFEMDIGYTLDVHLVYFFPNTEIHEGRDAGKKLSKSSHKIV